MEFRIPEEFFIVMNLLGLIGGIGLVYLIDILLNALGNSLSKPQLIAKLIFVFIFGVAMSSHLQDFATDELMPANLYDVTLWVVVIVPTLLQGVVTWLLWRRI